MKLKVCGMKMNPDEVATLDPDYMGLIFWEKSPRFVNGLMPSISNKIKKVGVFVNASIEEILAKVAKYGLKLVQLHGQESPELCKQIQEVGIIVIKVFGVDENFDFSVLTPYEAVCDYYLFDTKGKLPGGNGYTFDWEVLEGYPSTKPFFLSGGIGLENIDDILTFLYRPESRYCYAIDVNSKFEIQPGHKDIETLKEFKKKVEREAEKRKKRD